MGSLRDSRVVGRWWGFFALVGLYALFTFIIPVSKAVAGINSIDMPGALLASGVGGVAGVLLAGRISDRWPTRALPVSVVVLSVVLATIGIAHVPAIYTLFTVLWGVMIGILPVVLQSNVMRLASSGFRTLAGGILVTVLNLGVGLGAGLGSIVSSRGHVQVLPFAASAVVAFAIVPIFIFSFLRFGNGRPSVLPADRLPNRPARGEDAS